jgi:perosamine synthetase
MIHQIQPFLGEEEAKAAYDVVKSTWLTEGTKTTEYEEAIRKYTDYNCSLALSNWTDGLILCSETIKRYAAKFQKREIKTIIVPNLTFVASFNAPYFSGLRPFVLDVDKKSGQLDPNKCEDFLKKYTGKAKSSWPKIDAIMLVDLYGSCPDLDAFDQLAKKYDVFIIEDAAQALGVFYKGRHVGAYCINSVGGFSLYGNKENCAGEGGVFVTMHYDFMQIASTLKAHGGSKRGTFEHETVGFNFRIDDIRSAIAIEQLKKLDHIKNSKRIICELYQKELALSDSCIFPEKNKDIESNNWFFNLILFDRKDIQEKFFKNDIETRRIFKPLHMQECYKRMKENFVDTSYENSEYLYEHGLSFPTHPNLTISEVLKVIEAFKK